MATRCVATALLCAGVLTGCTSDQDFSGLPTEVPGAGPTTTVAGDAPTPPCDGPDGVGAEVPDGATAGDLVAAQKLDDSHGDTAGYPSDASVWRILYVSSGVDESDLQLVCGLAAAPDAGPATQGGTGRMLAWAHGTIGLQQRCLPSSDPATTFWGQMAGGIGAIAWGSWPGTHTGDPADGALQTALDRGWVISATDYQTKDTSVIGRIAATDVIDAARATTQLMVQEFGAEVTPETYDTISWGHSQGGHAALWAGQLFQSYQEGVPNDTSAELVLRGVAAEAPAANLIARPDRQDGTSFGDGLADWEMHKSIEMIGLPIPALELQIGPALFSYIFGSWSQFSTRVTPAAEAAFPAYPSDAANLDLDAVATDEGALTIARALPLCLAGEDAKTIKALTAPYRDAASHQMLTPDLWNLPEDYRSGQFFHGGVDRTCATTTDASMTAWCDWIRWNTPGPLGENPYPKAPMNDGEPVPLLIAQGTDDQVIHCAKSRGTPRAEVPAAADCMSSALFDDLRDGAYCPSAGDTGHLRLAMIADVGVNSPGSHLSIPGQIAARGQSKASSDLSFDGSPLERFMTDAFAGTLEPGCTAAVLNAG